MSMLIDAHSEGGELNLWKRLCSCELRMTVKGAVKGLLLCFSGKKSRRFGKGPGLGQAAARSKFPWFWVVVW